MNLPSLLRALSVLLLNAILVCAQAPAPAGGIDWQKARQLHERERRGEKLGEDDQRYLDEAKKLRQRGGGQAAQRKMTAPPKPLCDMTADDRYEGEDGGIYGQGRNEPPPELRRAAEAALAQIRPLDAEGKPSDTGRIVFVSLSMSNATQEFSFFKRLADRDPRKSERVTVVDCAQGGQAMAEWAPPEARPWQEALRRLEQVGVSPQQVQIAWVKLANKSPTGSMSEHLGKLEADTAALLQNVRRRFPNLRLAYLGSRIWAGNATGGLNPEPYAYESAFATRHLIQKQDLAQSPLLLWGPYLWSAGESGRRLDDLKYLPADFVGDGVHPSDSGREKVARQLLEFCATNALAKSWFAK